MKPTSGAGEVEEPSEVVRERQPEQHDVLGLGRGSLTSSTDGDHLVRVAVPDHARLRRAGRARGVDERVEVVLVDRGDRAVERAGVGGSVLAAAGREVVQVGEGQDVPHPADVGFDLVELGELLLVLDEDADRVGVVERVGAVVRRARRVDRDGDGADEGERVVEEHPLEARRGEDPERVALSRARARAGRSRGR